MFVHVFFVVFFFCFCFSLCFFFPSFVKFCFLRDNTIYPFFDTTTSQRSRTCTGLALCHGNTLVSMTHLCPGRTSTVPECLYGGRLWMAKSPLAHVTHAHGSGAQIHNSLTSTTTTFLPKTVGEHCTGSAVKMDVGSKQSSFVTRLSCYRRGNHDAVTHPRVDTSDALFLVEAGSQACYEDHPDHQA